MLDFIRIETVGRALAAFDFSPDGGRVIYALNTPFPVRSAEIFSLSDSTLERRLRATDDINDITALAWNPDGTRIAIASHIADTDALVFVDIATRARQMVAASTRIDTLSWSPDGARIAGGSRDLTIWDAATGDVLNDPVAAAQGALRSVAWNADSTQFVAGYDDGTVAVFDAETGESLAVYTTGAAGPAPASWNWADDTIGYPDASGNLIVQPAPQPVEAAGNT
jgi:WD40 repeat protein